MTNRPSWFGAIARLLLLRVPEDVPATASRRVVAFLSLAALASWIGIDWLRNQPSPDFYPYGLPVLAWYVMSMRGVAGTIARLSTPTLAVGRVLTFVLAATPVVIVVLYLIQFYISRPWAARTAIVGLCIYLVLYVGKSLRAMTGKWQLRALAVGIVLTSTFIWVTDQLFVDPSVWYAQDDESDDRADADDAEALLFLQPGLIDKAVARMAPSRAGAPGVFFIGFAGYAEQKVFAEEIKLAARTVADRFGSVNRELLLMNDRRSLNAAPLASPTALRYALRAVAARMNVEQDVLFLSLSSHGASDGTFSVSNGGLMLHDLTTEDLASALKESGIKWRVIVVSACYSGNFIEPLRSPRTVVITASAADRTSFGCSDDRDLTYFGEAFYHDALPSARSLREAFDQTRVAIAAREKAEGVEPSKPQAFFGEQIEKKLKDLVRRPESISKSTQTH